jgi:uncharacterized protein
MRYNVAQLLKGPTGARRQYEVEEEIGHLDEDLEPLCPLVGSVMLTRTSQGILVTGQLQTTLQVACRRCLEPSAVEVELELEEEFHPLVRPGEAGFDDVAREDWDEAQQIDEHHTLDLNEVVRQGLWVSAPMEALCRPDCRGLCPRCGGNRNLGECDCDPEPSDPRWAVLQTLIADESEERNE